MKSGCATVEEWKQVNAGNLIACRWGCRLTMEACLRYQTKSKRYVMHFQGEKEPLLRINSDFLTCVFPDPCPHFLPDEDAAALRERIRQAGDDDVVMRRVRQNEAKEKERLVNPDTMLDEADWNRSLITQ